MGALVDFEAFSKVLNRPGGFRDPGEPEEYCRGFQVFDKDMTGFIGVGQLRYSGLIQSASSRGSAEGGFGGIVKLTRVVLCDSLDELGREDE